MPNTRVTIYNDPITRRDPEGDAEVLYIDEVSQHLQQARCRVRFVDDGFETYRWVDHQQLNEAGFDVPAPIE